MIPGANIVNGGYQFMENLRQLNARHQPCGTTLPLQLMKIPTPLQSAAWERYLQIHPDQEFTQHIRNGVQLGFQTGFDCACKSAHKNMCSASKNREVVEKFLQSKQAASHIVLVPETESIKSLHTSPFGVVPKICQASQPQKWRLIDLSASQGQR